MPEIHVLPKQVADMIAAGEVVERPASAAKELIENAIDAGAAEITVEIRHGGVSYLRVTDNGCGIPADQVATAFLRHATSKIATEQDLEAISTLGFRGEALAAIAAVSHVEMLTRTPDASAGYTITIEGGETLHEGEAGCPVGTTVVVRSLFFNIPARYKFLKRDAAEGAAVNAVVQREALAHPEISFRFIRDGQQELSTPGDDAMESVLYAVMGRDFARDTVLIKGSGEDVAVTGYVTRPTACRGSRNYQHFFLNGRWIKSKLITAALENAYKNQKMVGKFPGGVLYIAARFSDVDVNSHPTKTEVKFVRDKDVYDAVYYAVLQALGGEDDRPVLHLTPDGFALPAGGPPSAELRRDYLIFDSPAAHLPPQKPTAGWDAALDAPAEEPPAAEGPASAPPLRQEAPPSPQFRVSQVFEPAPPPPQPEPSHGEQLTFAPTPAEVPWRVAGEVLNTYIIVEQGDTVFFIDKHAAHERMNFDELKTRGLRTMSQELLAPVVFRPSPEEHDLILANAALLEDFGFRAEDFGGGQLTVSRVPHFISPEEAPNTLSELAQKLLSGSPDPESQRDELLHTMACKAAIKGGQKNDPAELLRVAKAVMSGEVRHCPHGRPVCTELTRAQLERQFKRT